MKQVTGLSAPYKRFQDEFYVILDTLAQSLFIDMVGRTVCAEKGLELTKCNIEYEGETKLKTMNKEELINICKSTEETINYSVLNLVKLILGKEEE